MARWISAPANCFPRSAAGRVFIACLDPAVTAAVLARRDPDDPAAQAEEVRQLRVDFARHGYARQDLFGGFNSYSALGAPIRDDANELRYVLVALSPRAECAGTAGDTLAAALLAAADETSLMLGHRRS